MNTEDALIARIERRLAPRSLPASARRLLVRGMGDDAAILRPAGRFDWVLSADFSLEDVHFLVGRHSPQTIGYRALARAASDLAAMGAHPDFFLLSLALPARHSGAWLDRMLDGMAKAAAELGLRLIGGDTTRRPKLIFAITVIGHTLPGRALRRDRARPGDRIFVSGRLGTAALGLALLRRRLDKTSAYHSLLRPHLLPSIPIRLGIHLAEHRLASAAIDLSDGLSTDLARLARASGVAARLFAARLPAVRIPPSLARLRLDPLQLALHGGEDYGLLFTVPSRLAPRIPPVLAGTPLAAIGEILPGRGVRLVNSAGRELPLRPGGWDPFRHPRD